MKQLSNSKIELLPLIPFISEMDQSSVYNMRHSVDGLPPELKPNEFRDVMHPVQPGQNDIYKKNWPRFTVNEEPIQTDSSVIESARSEENKQSH